MSLNPFTPPFSALPQTLPIFPLPGAIVLPGAELPLNIFEPRYLNMVDDAMGGQRLIGMIQPDPAADNDIDICRTGCAGRVTQYRETADCRIEIVLTGICRFDVVEEMSTTRGYRLTVPDWSRFSEDYVDHLGALEDRHALLMATLQAYFDARGLDADMIKLERLPVMRLVDSLSMVLPFEISEKQLLLETVDTEARYTSFMALLEGEFEVPDSATRH